MKDTAEKKGVDLLVVDSGDLHDGNGLSDGYPVGGVDGQMVSAAKRTCFGELIFVL